MKKPVLTVAFATFMSVANACWYSKSNYTDYIYSVNGIQMMYVTTTNEIATYTITNNPVVDLPLTVAMKLISDTPVDLNNTTTNVPELIRGKLQYRVLPERTWVTVCEYNTPSGTISKESPPYTYFGSNNVWPKNCKAGDVIMIRLYITDGMWQSGKLSSLCGNKLTTISTPFGDRTSLPDVFQYRMNGSDVRAYNLGGAWYPHLVMTVIYSGKERPFR